tara:strand:- start:2390 stop:2827 length:438 start_codon:yes stop_codon:yes gene_type:complete
MDMVNILIEYGALGVFAAFLLMQHFSMQKRSDKQTKDFQDQLRNMVEKSDEKEQKLRERYDSVIETLQSDKSTLKSELGEAMKELKRSLQDQDKRMEGMILQSEGLSQSLNETKKVVEKGMDIIQNMENDRKLKEIAKQVVEGKN